MKCCTGALLHQCSLLPLLLESPFLKQHLTAAEQIGSIAGGCFADPHVTGSYPSPTVLTLANSSLLAASLEFCSTPPAGSWLKMTLHHLIYKQHVPVGNFHWLNPILFKATQTPSGRLLSLPSLNSSHLMEECHFLFSLDFVQFGNTFWGKEYKITKRKFKKWRPVGDLTATRRASLTSVIEKFLNKRRTTFVGQHLWQNWSKVVTGTANNAETPKPSSDGGAQHNSTAYVSLSILLWLCMLRTEWHLASKN